MISRKKKRILRLSLGLFCAVTIASANTSVYATPSSSELEGKTSELQSELNSLNSELSSLGQELDDVATQIETMAAEVEKNKLDLAAAKLNEDSQYSSMKNRIKFMYEGGNLSLLTILFSSENMSDFLNKAEYVSTISEYDRDMLDELHEICAVVEEKQNSLTKKQEELSSMQEELSQKKEALMSKISSTSGALADYSAQLEHAKAAEAALATAQNNKISGSVGGNTSESQNNGNTGTGSNNSNSNNNTSGGNITDDNGGGAVDSGNSMPADVSDVALLAAVLELESGASYDGMLAVGTVVMNRVYSPSFPNSIPEVIYQPGQFYPEGNPILNGVLSRGPSGSAYSAAQAVIGGTRYSSVADCYFFYSDWFAEQQGVTGVNVAGNVFFKSY